MSLDKNDIKAIADLMDLKLAPINSRLDNMDSRLDAMESRISRIENRLDKVESDVLSLRAGQIEIRKDLKALDDKVSETYQLALDAWGKSTENRTWLEKSQYSV